MARVAKGFSHKRVTTESVTIKGYLSDDGATITYTDDDQEKTVSLKECLERFADNEVEFRICIKNEDDLAADDE